MKKGFTLLEMMVTIVLLTVGITSILRMFSMAMVADINLENTTIARYLAQEAMDLGLPIPGWYRGLRL